MKLADDMVFLLWILSILSAVIYGGISCRKQASVLRTVIKTLPVGLLALIAALSGAPVLLILALGLSALGDLMLAKENDQGFLAGMAAFFAAHVGYVVLFFNLSGAHPVGRSQEIGSAILILSSLAVYFYLRPGLGKFRLPVALYMISIIAMGLAAFGLPAGNAAGLITFGAGLFIISDTFLAVEKFRPPSQHRLRRPLPYLVWAFYWFAQVFILLGVLRWG